MGISADLFYTSSYGDDTLYRRIVPSEEQLCYLRANKDSLADYLISSVSLHFGISCATWIQGSYKFGTLIRPVCVGMEYDVDLGFYLTPNNQQSSQKIPDAASYRGYIRALLDVYATSDGEVEKIASPSKDKCERVHYKRDFHIDVPAYKLISGQHMLAVLPNSWSDSDPKKLYLWFKDVCQSVRDGGQLRRFIQYFKNWSAQKFHDLDKEYQPTSIMLTVLVADAYVKSNGVMPRDDDDGFSLIVDKVLSRLEGGRSVLNPVDKSEDLNQLSSSGFENFLNELRDLRGVAVAAGKATNRFYASRLWEKAFGHFFPIDADGYEVGGALTRISPSIEVDVLENQNGPVYVSGAKNAVNSVPKGCWLNFRITNQESLPLGCTVEWVVRNMGKEAMNTNDMGHKAVGLGMFNHQEHTAYSGTHFMDCSVYNSKGEFYSFRRVPVSILNTTLQKIRNPDRSNYRGYGKR